jgi:hypothetical protein
VASAFRFRAQNVLAYRRSRCRHQREKISEGNCLPFHFGFLENGAKLWPGRPRSSRTLILRYFSSGTWKFSSLLQLRNSRAEEAGFFASSPGFFWKISKLKVHKNCSKHRNFPTSIFPNPRLDRLSSSTTMKFRCPSSSLLLPLPMTTTVNNDPTSQADIRILLLQHPVLQVLPASPLIPIPSQVHGQAGL